MNAKENKENNVISLMISLLISLMKSSIVLLNMLKKYIKKNCNSSLLTFKKKYVTIATKLELNINLNSISILIQYWSMNNESNNIL